LVVQRKLKLSNEPYDGATPEQLRHPMVREFLGIHNMFRNELTKMLDFVNELSSGEQQLNSPETKNRIQIVISAGTRYTQLLHMHHHAETSMVFPALAAEGLAADVINRLNTDHDEIAVLIDNFSVAIRSLATVQPAVMDNDLRRLSEALHAHLAYEETHVCPFLARFSNW
jgi:hemerythrin-like domain-containing protein